MNSKDVWADEKARKWRLIAEEVLRCRVCNFISSGNKLPLFHPDPGEGNVYAPVFVIGINSNWGKRNQQFTRPRAECYSHGGGDRKGPDPQRYFETYSSCGDCKELSARLGTYYDYPVNKNDKYDRTLFHVLCGILGNACNGQHAQDKWSREMRILLWHWVYWSNAVRCPSGDSGEIGHDEFGNCFWTKERERPPGNVLKEELQLVSPSLVIVFGFPTIRNNAPSGQRIESHLGELLGMEAGTLREVPVDGKCSVFVCEYVNSVRRVCALFLPHPSARGVPVKLWEQACQTAGEWWKSCKGTRPSKPCCVNVLSD